MTSQQTRKPYPSDVTDAQWELLAPFIPPPGPISPREPMRATRAREWDSLRAANRLFVETDAP